MITAFMLKLLHAVRRWYRRRTAIRELYALDDRLLEDIGISRSEIVAAVEGALRSAPPRREMPEPASPSSDGTVTELPDWTKLGYGAEVSEPGLRTSGR